MASPHPRRQFGSLQRDLPFFKDLVDYRLTRFPRLYLLVERFRNWINWDKRVYLSFVRRGDVVLDIGANVGSHAVFLSHLVGGEGKVLAFEPLAPNIDALKETLRRRSRALNVSIFQLAVGNPSKPGQVVGIRVPGDDFTQASLRLQAAGSWGQQASVHEYTVFLTSLDANPDVQALPSIDFVKIDVEGGELDVFRGGAQTIRRHLPLIYCEAYEKWTASFGYAPVDLFAFARSLGYTGARVISLGVLHVASFDRHPPPGMFESSSDILFFASKHAQLVDAFDKRYLR